MIKINKLFIPYIILLLIIGFKGQLEVAFLIVLFHEMIHYIVALQFGFSGFDIEIFPVGAVLKLKELDEASPKEDIMISLSAPLVNLIAAGIFYFIFYHNKSSYIYYLYIGNLTIGAFNLIPAFPLDGGRVLRSVISLKTIYKRANIIALRLSIIMGMILFLSSVILLLLGINNLTMAIVSVFIIVSSFREKERIAYIIMGDIVKKRYKFIKLGFIENKSISIYYKKDLITALSIMDKNKYNIFTILDDDLKVMDIIYEEEIVEALKVYGNMDFNEYISVREENE